MITDTKHSPITIASTQTTLTIPSETERKPPFRSGDLTIKEEQK